MADGNLGHLSVQIGLDIKPFLTNAVALKSQISRTAKLIGTLQERMNNGWGKGTANTLFKAQSSQLELLNKRYQYLTQSVKEAQDAISKGGGVDAQRQLVGRANNLSQTALQIDNLKQSMVTSYQQMVKYQSGWGQLSEKLTNFGSKAHAVADGLRNIGSWGGTMAVGGALASAANKAMEFKSQIAQIGPLLSNTGRVTSSIRKEMEQMSNASLKWSQQYGVSTTEINNSMMELIRRGFTTNQVMGSMPALLDAVKASGEDMNTVMQSSASVIEAFGLKADTAAQQTKNMRMVTDGLTYVANATASSYADLSTGLNYVGQTAAAAHVSFMDTAIALGIMSNKGVEASTAGTALRQMFTTLTKDTKVNRAHLKAIGLDFDEIKKKGIDLPDIIDRVSKALADKTPTEQMALLNAAFGKTGQSAIALFQKSKAGSKSAAAEFREYQKEGNAAAGVTKRIAQEMNNTPQAKWERFKQTLNAVAIEVGSNVLPALEPVVQGLGNMAKAFGKLDPSTQQAIVKFALFYAAIKPVTSFIAGPIDAIGKLSKGIGSLADTLGTLKAGSKASIWQKLFGGATEAAEGATKVASGLTAAGTAGTEAATGLTLASTAGAEAAGGAGLGALIPSLATITAALPYVAAGVIAAGAAWATWEFALKPVVDRLNENNREVQHWGTTVGPVVDNVASKYKEYAVKTNDALNDNVSNTKQNTEEIKKSFDEMAKSAEDSVKRQKKALENLSQKVGGSAGKYLKQQAEDYEKNAQKSLKSVKEAQKQADTIISNAQKNHEKIAGDVKVTLQNLNQEMMEGYVQTLNISKTKQQEVLQALEGTFTGKLSTKKFAEMQNSITDAFIKSRDKEKSALDELKKAYDDNLISYDQYTSAKAKVSKDFQDKEEQFINSYINLQRNQGYSWQRIAQNLKTDFGITSDSIAQSYINSYKKMESATKKSGNTILSETGKLTKAQKEAAHEWNSMVLDPKTGKVSTNAKQTLLEAVNSEKGWKDIQFIEKHAKMTTNAKSLLAQAIFESQRWNSLSLSEKKAIIATKGGKELFSSLDNINQWNNLNPKIQELIVTAKNKDEIYSALQDLETWNNLTPEQKKLFIDNADAHNKIILTLQDIQQYQNLTPSQKKLIIDAAESGKNVAEILQQLGIWNSLPVSVKKLITDNSDINGKVDTAINKINEYNKKEPAGKNLQGHNEDVIGKVTGASTSLNNYRKVDPGLKIFKGNNIDAVSKAAGASNAVNKYKNLPNPTKYLKANSNNAVSNSNAAIRAITQFMHLPDSISKTISVVYKAITGKHATGTPGAWLFNPNAYAYGTPNTGAKGGLAWVGDGGRKEIVFDSAMKAFYETPKTPTLVNLPRGSMVWRSVEQFEQAMRHAKLLANGTLGNSIVSLANQIPDDVSGAVKAMRAPSINVDNSNLLELQEQNNELLATLIEQNQQMLQALMNLGFSFNVDGKQMANAQAENNSKAINEYLKRTGLRFS